MTLDRAIGRFRVRQTSGDEVPRDVGRYDLILSTVSWESRCTFAVKKLGERIKKLHVFRFETTDRENEKLKSGFMAEMMGVADVVEQVTLGKSIAYASNTRLIEQILSESVKECRRPVRVLIDVTCFPKSYILFLLGIAFEKGYLAKLDCLYSEGSYPSDEVSSSLRASSDHGPISEGKWETLAIPFFEADIVIPKGRDLLVTVGGEVGLTVPFIEKYEPTRLRIVRIERSIGDQGQLDDLLKEPNVSQTRIDICDALGVAEEAAEFSASSSEEVVTALAVGSKPHAIGLGIAALTERKMEVVCRVPKRYTMMNIQASGRLMAYEIEDRFEPHAYL